MSKEVQVIRGKMRQTFSDEEKQRIVAESYRSELSLSKFAKSVGIAPPTLCVWRKQLKTSCTQEPPESHALITVENGNVVSRLEELEEENQKLKSDLSTFKRAFGQKLVELEMMRLGNLT